MSRLLPVILALGVLFGAASCKTWRRLTGRQKPVAASDSAKVVTADSALTESQERIGTAGVDSGTLLRLQHWVPLLERQTNYSTLNARAKVDYEGGGESHEFNANIRMERDKGIWISVTALLGIEVARTLITPDTIVLIDRMHKEVRVLPFGDADKILPVRVDFPTLQRLIIGDVLQTAHAMNELGDTTEEIVLRAVHPDFVQEVTFSRADSLLQSQSLSSSTSTLHSIYRDHEMMQGRSFAKARELTMQSNGDTHRFRLEFTKVTFDGPVDLGISIPSKYERK